MYLFRVAVVGALCASAAAVPTPAGAPSSSSSQSPYPARVNSTDPRADYLTIRSSDPRTNGRNVQLRQTKSAVHIPVVDASSPVLLMQMRGGVILSQNRTVNNQPYDLGPTAALKNVSTTATSSLQELSFVNATDTQPPTADFYLTDVSIDGLYQLYHDVHANLVINGFTLCPKNDYFQLFYYTYIGSQMPEFGQGCEWVGVQTTVAPVVQW